jgi:hypothetical protein
MNIKSEKVTVSKTQDGLYNYLLNLDNIQHILPQGKFSDWEGSEDKCSFKIQGYVIALEKYDQTPSELIRLRTTKDSPIDFDLDISLKSLGENSTEAFMNCEARVNAFLKMMIKKPLGNLFEYMTGRLEKVEI